jgi:hypothetical protein
VTCYVQAAWVQEDEASSAGVAGEAADTSLVEDGAEEEETRLGGGRRRGREEVAEDL